MLDNLQIDNNHPLTVQTEVKKEEGLRGWWVYVSLGFL